MLSQNQIKHITALKVKKFREEQRQFIAEGHKLVLDLLGSEFNIAGIYASAEWIIENLPEIRKKNIPVFETLPREMERISSLSTPSPVLAVINLPLSNHQIDTSPHSLTGKLTLALDDIRDPGNLGTIIRIADWFGISTVLCSESCVDTYNPKVVQATMGSIVRVNVIRCNLIDVLTRISATGNEPCSADHLPVYGTFLEGESLFLQPLSNYGIIVIGNESRGISAELIPFITQKLYIPSFGTPGAGKAESLNASIATAIICAEFRRKSEKNS